jgi:hypothetical protein
MSYTISLSTNGKYLIMQVTGKLTAEVVWAYSIEVIRRAAKLGISRFLFDVREAVNVESVLKDMTLSYTSGSAFYLNRNVRSAILTNPFDEFNNVTEDARLKTNQNVRLFSNLEEAVTWLEG